MATNATSPKPRTGARVSVVIANCNMARFVADAIDSALHQTRPPFEIHVVDDGSTDDSRNVIRRYESEPSVFLHCQANQGQAKAKNRGIRQSSGDLIAFLDADDVWTPRKLELQVPVFDAYPQAGVVYTNYAHIDSAGALLGSPVRSYYEGWISSRLLVDNFVTGMAAVVRRECFERVGLFDESLPMGIDYDLWLRISAHYEFRFLNEVTYLYRQWPGQMSHRRAKRMDCAMFIMKRFLAQHPGLVDPGTVREAWAHTFLSRGSSAFVIDNDRRAALRDYARALAWSPAYAPAWKAVAKLVLGVRR